MGAAALCAAAVVALGASPTFAVDARLAATEAVEQEARAHWAALEALYVDATGEPAAPAAGTVRVLPAAHLAPGENGESRPERIELRQARPGALDAAMATALRHELAHQFLWAACPASAEDRLFHEAFAVATSGERTAWEEAPYLSLSGAAGRLEQQPRSVGLASGRRALARLLGESAGPSPRALPRVLRARLARCAARWQWPRLSVGELADQLVAPAFDAFVVLSRHSGEVLQSQGAVKLAMPFGSTLKPFVFAALEHPPALPPKAERGEWLCGEQLPARLSAREALLRSCNGYFLDVATAGAPPLGGFGEALVALGLPELPRGMAEAIGLEGRLTLSPLQLASAYLLLAEGRPDVLAVLRDNVAQGTLSELPASSALRGLATKTGTVRDARLRPVVGWIVAVDEDVVAVMARAGRMPRAFADELAGALAPFRGRRAHSGARVQALGLLPPSSLQARCAGTGFSVSAAGARPVARDFAPLPELVRGASAVCVGGPWRVRFPGIEPAGREYAGVFSFSPAPPYRPPPGAPVPERALKARRGSDFLFRTTLARYVAGVLESEDAQLRGEARVALARVVAHDLTRGHGARGACDTTHCQVFQGTRPPRQEELGALALPPLKAERWLPFSRGGEEPWEERRTLREVEQVLGAAPSALRFTAGEARFVRREGSAAAPFDSAVRLPCEVLRNPLRLRSCPEVAVREPQGFLFRGRGEGHGQGLDVEAAKQSGLSHEELLRRAYGLEK